MTFRTKAAAWLALLMSALVGVPAAAEDLDPITVVIPQNSVFVLSYNGAKDAGVFRKHAIDLQVDARPFAGFLAGLPSRQCLVTTYAGLEAIAKINQGFDWAVIGGGLTVFNDVFVRTDSPVKAIEDLRGKRFGVWSTSATTFQTARAEILDSAGLDLMKDTRVVQLAPPALLKLLARGDIDGTLEISSFTIKALSEPDKFRPIFSPNGYWRKKTGYPIVWTGPIVAWKSWIDENPDRARRMAAATEESFRWLRDPRNFDAAVKKYGKLAGVSTPQAVATYKKLLGEKRIFLAHWDQKAIDAEWQFLEVAKRYGILDKVPDKKTHALMLGE